MKSIPVRHLSKRAACFDSRVIPAKAGIQPLRQLSWIPALRFAAAGMTFRTVGTTVFCLALVLLIPNLCAAADKSKPRTPQDALKSHMEQCTAKYGFDPDKTQGLGERELGKGEEEWRSCVYEGIRKYVAPKSAVPKLYFEFIDQDRKLTDLIKKGEMTRSQRKQKNVALLEEIKQQEEARQADQLKQKQKDMDEAMRKKMELDMRRGGSPMHAQDSLMRGMGR